MPKKKISVEDKRYAVNLYPDGKESQQRIASMFDVSIASVQPWIHMKGEEEIFQRIEAASSFGLFSRWGAG